MNGDNTSAILSDSSPISGSQPSAQVPVFRASRGICRLGLNTSIEMNGRPEGCCLSLCGLSFPSTRQLCLAVCLDLRLHKDEDAQPI
jgi:hypothetical protein